MEKQDILQTATLLWGNTSQVNQLQEELTELSMAICKLRRSGDIDKKMGNFFEEIADVKIMIEQMEFLYGTKEIEKHYEYKIKRLGDRVNNSLMAIPYYFEMKKLLENEILNKYFNLVISQNMCYLKSKNEKILIQSSSEDDKKYDILLNSSNYNNKYVKRYCQIILTDLMNIDEKQIIESIKYLYNQ